MCAPSLKQKVQTSVAQAPADRGKLSEPATDNAVIRIDANHLARPLLAHAETVRGARHPHHSRKVAAKRFHYPVHQMPSRIANWYPVES